MFDAELVVEVVGKTAWAIDQVLTRFSSIGAPDDFTQDDQGLERLDGICMQLINIGEALKHIDKLTDGKLLPNYPDIDWKKAKGMRDIISHHYFDVDAETIYFVCRDRLPAMRRVIDKILDDLRAGRVGEG